MSLPRPASPGFQVPSGACDSHLHVFGPHDRHPFAPGRSYSPPEALDHDAREVLDRLGMERAVLVQPSVYGFDNSCQLDADLGRPTRVVAQLAGNESEAELFRLQQRGVRGVRLNVASGGGLDEAGLGARMTALAARLAPLGWHLQLHLEAETIVAREPELADLPVEVVIDHLGLVPAADPAHPAVDSLLRLLATGRVWVKLSGSDRLEAEASNVEAMVRRLVDARPDRLVWGSDWPHTGREPRPDGLHGFRSVDTGELLRRLGGWLTAKELQLVLADNPARLYGFA